jgi:phospholipid-translocating ATPase
MQVPQIYLKGIRQELYNMELFWAYILDGVYQSVICYFTSAILFSDAGIHPDGFNSNRDEIGTFLSFFCVITVNIYLALNNFTWNWITHTTLWVTLLVFFLYVVIYLSSAQFSEAVNFAIPSLVDRIFKVPAFYLSLMLAVVASLIPRMLFKYTQQVLFPSDTDILQEYQVTYWREGVVVDLARPRAEEMLVIDEERLQVPSERHKRTPSVISQTRSIPEGMYHLFLIF